MAYKFPSQAWADQFLLAVNRNDAYASAAKTWEGDLYLVIEEGGVLYLDLWHGKCREVLWTRDANSSLLLQGRVRVTAIKNPPIVR